MDDFRADLHCHSTCSDGSLPPLQLLQRAQQKGLKGLSITDHDTFAAYDKTLFEASHQLGIELISGIEFSSCINEVPIHVLGYAFDLNHPGLKAFCEKHIARRENRNRAMIERLNSLGMSLSYEDLETEYTIGFKRIFGRPHIAKALMDKGYVQSIQEAFKGYLGEGKPAYIKGVNFSMEETLDVIHQASGLAFIAHPHLIRNDRLIIGLLKYPFDGLEGYYSQMHLQQNERWLNLAKKKRWLLSGGSDFHGEARPHVELGCSWVDEATFRPLRAHHVATNPLLS